MRFAIELTRVFFVPILGFPILKLTTPNNNNDAMNDPQIEYPYKQLFNADGLEGMDLARWIQKVHPSFSNFHSYTLSSGKVVIWECNAFGIWARRYGTEDMHQAIGISVRKECDRNFVQPLETHIKSMETVYRLIRCANIF